MANTVQCMQLNKSELYRHNSCGNVQKFYRRPLVPFLNSEVQKLRLSNNSETVEDAIRIAEEQCSMLPSRLEYVQNRGTQTDYRESECQTSPWEPPYKIISGHNPEVLTLAHLTWKQGLPVGMHEVEILNRMRMRRAWESILPPMDSEANIKLRTNIISALEADDWSFRETEIEFVMNLRMELARKLMETRNHDLGEKKEDRFRKLRNDLGQRRDKEIRNIRHKFRRELRKLATKHRCKTGKRYRRPDIIKLHADRASELYAPQMRFGKSFSRRHEVLQMKCRQENFLDSAEMIDTKLSKLPTTEELKSIKPKPKPGDLCIRATRWNDDKIEELYSELRKIRLNTKSSESICHLERREKSQIAPPTPFRYKEENIEKVLDQSSVLIQKTIRGRAIQYLMYEGRERCRELIEEFRSTCVLQKHDRKVLEKEKKDILSLQYEQHSKIKQENRLSEILNSLEGMTVSRMLDYLSKELQRLQGEREAHAFALLAERERSRREAAEAGRRQLECQRRRELDEIFKQIVKVNQDSVETYLEDIIKEGIDWVSEEEAKEYVMTLADKIDSVSKYTAENAAELDEEEMVSDMVYNFVLPEVEKEIMRKKLRDKQRRYLSAAHEAIYDRILDLPSRGVSESEEELEENKNKNVKESSTSRMRRDHTLDKENYKNVIDTVVDQIMTYVVPDENMEIIREILSEVILETQEREQAESINEFSFSSCSTFSDSPDEN